MPRESVFKDESKLDINYIPQTLPHREREQRLLMEFFNFILKTPDRMAQRVILTGDVGTGKTALAQRFGANLTTEANKRGIKFRYVHLNCRENRGNLSQTIHQAITVYRPNYPARGFSTEDMQATLLKVLDEESTHMVLALDEFDSLIEKEGSDAVYKLTRLQETRQGKPQRLSFIFIMRSLNATSQLDESARSTLQRSIISLERYGKLQLIDILSDRVAMAFELSTVSEDVIDLIAELAFAETGNARFGIELLWRAGKYADAEEAGAVAPECVRMAVSNVVPSLRRSELSSLGLHEKIFLLAIARFFKENEAAYISLTDAETAYQVACEEYSVEPKSHSQLWTYVQYLSTLGALKTEVSAQRGRTTRISLPTIPAVELEREMSANLAAERS